MDELQSISILKSYVESIDELARWDIQLAQELSYRVIQYGIKWIEPPVDSNPFMLASFKQIKHALDKGRSKSKNAKNKSNGNQTKIKWESNENQIEIKSESNWNQIEIKLESNSDKIKNKNKNKKNKIKNKNNNINLTVNTETNISDLSKNGFPEFWNSDVNACLELIKSFNNGIVDWTVQNQRRFAKHLVDKLKKLQVIQSWEFTWQQILELILRIGSESKFHYAKITSPELIYRNLAMLLGLCKNEIKSGTDNILPVL